FWKFKNIVFPRALNSAMTKEDLRFSLCRQYARIAECECNLHLNIAEQFDLRRDVHRKAASGLSSAIRQRERQSLASSGKYVHSARFLRLLFSEYVLARGLDQA